MCNPGFIRTLCTVGFVIFVLMRTAAAQTTSAVIHFSGRPGWSMTTTASVTDNENNASKNLLTIFSNLGTGRPLYVATAGWDVAGPDSGVTEQSVAMPFTPRFNAEISRIVVAVTHQHGMPNSFVVSLNEDNTEFGTPGSVIHSWVIQDAPSFGTCCVLDTVRAGKAITVKKGSQYWVVARTNARQAATHLQWNISVKANETNFSFNNGQGWFEFTAFPSAFGVFGRKAD